METSLHRQLKQLYADDAARIEVRHEGYRIDVVRGDELIEIQHGSLAAIRDKIRRLVESNRVLVVKPIVTSKLLVWQEAVGGRVVSRRMSPRRGKLLDIFDELVYFTRVFPHRNLSLEVLAVEIEEWRYPGHGRRRRWRRNDHVVEDQRLVGVGESVRVATPADLVRLIDGGLPARFHSGHVAEQLSVPRHFAQRIVYCLREMQGIRQVAKQGNTRIYQRIGRRRKAA